MVEYQYLRPAKAKYMKKREEADFPKVEVGFKMHRDCTILPLRKLANDNLLFGRGGGY